MPEQTCQQPVCATCRHRGHSGSRDYPGEDHPFTPTPCGEALVPGRRSWDAQGRSGWRCPIHGEVVRA